MMVEPNLTYEKDRIYARGQHDPVGKCLLLKAGSSGLLCKNPKRTFFGLPTILRMYEDNILPNTTSAGDDTQYYLQKDLRCYPTDNYDELSVAASLMAGVLVKGENVWRNSEGVSVRKMRSKIIPAPAEETEENAKQFDAATLKTFEMINSKRDVMIDILSLAYHLKTTLGTKNEDRFTVPRQVDNCMKSMGFLCEEEAAYDLLIPEFNYMISDKMANFLFHHDTSKKARTDIIKDKLQMSNVRSGQSGDNHQAPKFDCLLAMQYIPFLVCGIVPYHKIASHFRHTDGGWILSKVPVDYFTYVISPTEGVPPRDITPEIQGNIDEFVKIVQGGFLPKLLDKMPQVVDTPIPKVESW